MREDFWSNAVIQKTYGRGQVELAVASTFFGKRIVVTKDIPKKFRNRIKHLIDLDKDKKTDFNIFEVPPEAKYVFAPPAGENNEVAYEAIDAFCIATALDLLDAGFQQREVVYRMRYFRPELEQRFPELLAPSPFLTRQTHLPKDFPKLPVYEEDGNDTPDGRIFAILQKIELTEIVLNPPAQGSPHPIIFEPILCKGINELGAELFKIMPLRRRAATVLELAWTALSVTGYLEKVPEIRRGRNKA